MSRIRLSRKVLSIGGIGILLIMISTVILPFFNKQTQPMLAEQSKQKELGVAIKPKLLRTLRGHSGQVYSVSFSTDKKLLASASNDGTVKVWDVQTGRLIRNLPDNGTPRLMPVPSLPSRYDPKAGKRPKYYKIPVNTVAFSPDGKTLASGGGDAVIRLRDTSDWKIKNTLKGHRDAVAIIIFSPDGSLLASGSGAEIGTLEVRDMKTGKQKWVRPQDSEPTTTLSFSPDGSLLASSGSFHESAVKLWDAKTGKLQKIIRTDGSHSVVAFSRDGDIVATGSTSSSKKANILWDIKWNTRPGKTLQELDWLAVSDKDMGFSPNGYLLAVGFVDPRLLFWNMKTGKRSFTIDARSQTNVMAFTSDSTLLATGHYDTNIRLWEVAEPS